MKKLKVVISLILFMLINVNVLWAIDETKVISSSDKVLKAWMKVLSEGVNEVSYVRSGYWKVRRYVLIEGSIGYDIKKTDSIISPYKLIISFKTNYYDNDNGPKANAVFPKGLNKWYGYKTAEEALINTTPSDFPDIGDLECTVYYALQQENWIYKGGDKYFMANFGEAMETQKNSHYYKDLFTIPVE